VKELGIQKAFFPEKMGGLGITSNVTGCIMWEELARGDVGLSIHMSIIPWVFWPAIATNNETLIEIFATPF
jgi:alkylation response protein AidB-like acyl-CoA dehydrogenase